MSAHHLFVLLPRFGYARLGPFASLFNVHSTFERFSVEVCQAVLRYSVYLHLVL